MEDGVNKHIGRKVQNLPKKACIVVFKFYIGVMVENFNKRGIMFQSVIKFREDLEGAYDADELAEAIKTAMQESRREFVKHLDDVDMIYESLADFVKEWL